MAADNTVTKRNTITNNSNSFVVVGNCVDIIRRFSNIEDARKFLSSSVLYEKWDSIWILEPNQTRTGVFTEDIDKELEHEDKYAGLIEEEENEETNDSVIEEEENEETNDDVIEENNGDETDGTDGTDETDRTDENEEPFDDVIEEANEDKKY